MAAFNASAQQEGNSVSAITTPTFAVNGTDRVLVAFCATDDGNQAYPTSVTYDLATPENLTRDTTASTTSGGYLAGSTWVLDNPTSGTDSVTATWGGNRFASWVAACSFTAADTPADPGANTNNSITVNNAVADDVIVGMFFSDLTGAITSGADQTRRETNTDIGSYTHGAVDTQTDFATDSILSWTPSNTDICVAIRVPDAAGGTEITAVTGAGGLVLEGFSPFVEQGLTVRPGNAELILQGFTPLVRQGLTARVGDGALVLEGFSPTVLQGVTVRPGAGALILEGFAASLDLGAEEVTVTPGPGELVIAGFAPSVLQGLTASPGAGALILEGFPATANAQIIQTVTPGVAQLVLQGFGPSVGQLITVAPANAELVLECFAPTLNRLVEIAVTPGTGQLVIDGQAPVLLTQPVVVAEPGYADLLIRGHPATVLCRYWRERSDASTPTWTAKSDQAGSPWTSKSDTETPIWTPKDDPYK